MDENLRLITECKRQIAEKLNIGLAAEWKQRDFEHLAEEIFKETEVLLSLSTLKRLWAKNYTGVPQVATLNALAKYMGCNDWNHFRKINSTCNEPAENENTSKVWSFYFAIPAGILSLAVFGFLFFSPAAEPDISSLDLSAKVSVEKGVPNNIQINYSVDPGFVDDFKLVARWSPFDTIKLRENKGVANLISYFPGYHRTKLIYKDEVVKEKSVLVKTDGWMATYRVNLSQTSPVYIKPENFVQEKSFHINPKKIADFINKKKNGSYFIDYYNYGNMEMLNGDNFSLAAEFSNSIDEGGHTCQYFIITIDCENGRIRLPFCDPGCIGKIGLVLSEILIPGRTNYLQSFGTDMNIKNNLALTVADQNVTVNLNEKTIYESDYKNSLGEIKGFHLMFYGSGSLYKFCVSDGSGKAVENIGGYFN